MVGKSGHSCHDVTSVAFAISVWDLKWIHFESLDMSTGFSFKKTSDTNCLIKSSERFKLDRFSSLSTKRKDWMNEEEKVVAVHTHEGVGSQWDLSTNSEAPVWVSQAVRQGFSLRLPEQYKRFYKSDQLDLIKIKNRRSHCGLMWSSY